MNAGWILRVALAGCGAVGAGQFFIAGALGQSQFSQPPASASARIVAQQQAPQYSGQQYAQPAAQTYPQGSSFTQQPAAAQPRSSVFSTQPTASASAQGWNGATATGANDPRYTNDPRYAAAPQLSPPDNSSAQQQYTNQLNAAAAQFNNTLRDAQQQGQQYGQQAQQIGQTAQAWQQQAEQYGQQAQPYLSSLTNNPYAYVPAQPQPDPAANQYLAANSQTAESEFGRSVLVNNQQQPASSFGHQNNQSSFGQNSNGQPASNQFGIGQHANNQYTGTQIAPQLPDRPYDNRGQFYQPTSGQSAFTNSGQANTSTGGQDPRLMQTPTLNDPRYAQAQDPRAAQDPRTLALEPPLGATLPHGNGQLATTGASGQIASPYENLQPPRADGQNGTASSFGAGGLQSPANATTSFASGTKTEVPSLFNNVLPTNGTRAGQPFGAGQFNAAATSGLNATPAAQNPLEPDKAHLWNVLIGCLVVTFASIGANFYFGWNFTEYYFRYRKLLVEGDDDDRSRSRDDDRR